METSSTTLTAVQAEELLGLLPQVDSVELKFTIPDAQRSSTMQALGVDPLNAQIRQVVFFDTPGLDLDARGLVVRARRIQREAGDSTVKLRPVVPAALPDALRQSPGFKVEVDAMPGGFVCSGSMKAAAKDSLITQVVRGEKPVRKLFTKEQRALFELHASDLSLDDLAPLGPITILKLKFTPDDFSQRLVAELWFYPDGSRILELSTKCPPIAAFTAAAEGRAYLESKGLDLGAPQQTKTRAALNYFAGQLTAASSSA